MDLKEPGELPARTEQAADCDASDVETTLQNASCSFNDSTNAFHKFFPSSESTPIKKFTFGIATTQKEFIRSCEARKARLSVYEDSMKESKPSALTLTISEDLFKNITFKPELFSTKLEVAAPNALGLTISEDLFKNMTFKPELFSTKLELAVSNSGESIGERSVLGNTVINVADESTLTESTVNEATVIAVIEDSKRMVPDKAFPTSDEAASSEGGKKESVFNKENRNFSFKDEIADFNKKLEIQKVSSTVAHKDEATRAKDCKKELPGKDSDRLNKDKVANPNKTLKIEKPLPTTARVHHKGEMTSIKGSEKNSDKKTEKCFYQEKIADSGKKLEIKKASSTPALAEHKEEATTKTAVVKKEPNPNQKSKKRSCEDKISDPSKKPRAELVHELTVVADEEENNDDIFMDTTYDPEETADFNDPGWNSVRNLKKPDDVFKYIRQQWRFLSLPNPHNDLTKRYNAKSFRLKTPSCPSYQNRNHDIATYFNSRIQCLERERNRLEKRYYLNDSFLDINAINSVIDREISTLNNNKKEMIYYYEFYYDKKIGLDALKINNKQFKCLQKQDDIFDKYMQFYGTQ